MFCQLCHKHSQLFPQTEKRLQDVSRTVTPVLVAASVSVPLHWVSKIFQHEKKVPGAPCNLTMGMCWLLQSAEVLNGVQEVWKLCFRRSAPRQSQAVFWCHHYGRYLKLSVSGQQGLLLQWFLTFRRNKIFGEAMSGTEYKRKLVIDCCESSLKKASFEQYSLFLFLWQSFCSLAVSWSHIHIRYHRSVRLMLETRVI